LSNYFDHLLSLDTPTWTVAQIDKRFEPSTVLWAFHTIQPSSLLMTVLIVELDEFWTAVQRIIRPQLASQ